MNISFILQVFILMSCLYCDQAMADQIEQMGVVIETHQKVSICDNFSTEVVDLLFSLVWNWNLQEQSMVCYKQQSEEWRDRYDAQVRQCSDLSSKLSTAEVSWVGLLFRMFFMFELTFLKWVKRAEKFQSNYQIAHVYWRRIEEVSIWFEREGFYHIWAEKSRHD